MFITYVRYGMRSISSKSMSTAADEGDDPPEGSSSALRLSVRQGLLDNARRIRHVGNHCFRGPLVDLEAFMLVGGHQSSSSRVSRWSGYESSTRISSDGYRPASNPMEPDERDFHSAMHMP